MDVLAPYLNETACFVQNDVVSCFFKKKEQNSVVLSDTVPPSSSPGHAAGEDISFFFSSLLLPAACPAKTRSPTPPHDEKLGEPRPASHTHWPTNPASWQASKALLPMRTIGRQ